jgi:hypothetical protein
MQHTSVLFIAVVCNCWKWAETNALFSRKGNKPEFLRQKTIKEIKVLNINKDIKW